MVAACATWRLGSQFVFDPVEKSLADDDAYFLRPKSFDSQ